ncbi:hypothetical protein [Rhizobium anhuiense]|uniref:hypothetical protein n=1 Tax=Rhizobium anhuiense TaxID=1184720 RepID=UPI0015CEFE0D|nr:hypothetical protein [Rhizobium anhuiense]
MAILFKTTISENSAFEMIEQALSGAYQYDGYLNVIVSGKLRPFSARNSTA